MSGGGNPAVAVPENASDLRVAIVAGSWHERVMNGLIDGAVTYLSEAGIDPHLVRVPGSFELPVVCARLAQDFDAVVALGVVIRGGTPHFEYVSSAVTLGLNRVTLDNRTPIGFGVLTCDTLQQALDRAGLPGSPENKGQEAASAAVETALLLRNLG